MSVMDSMTDEQRKGFLDLCVAMSPENLSCDGEAADHEVQDRLRDLQTRWHALEVEAGCKVSEDEIWAWDEARSASRPRG